MSRPGVRAGRVIVRDPRLAMAVWSRITEPGDTAAWRLVAELGPVEALRTVATGQAGPGRWRVRLPDADLAEDLRVLGRHGGRLVVPGDEEWPESMADLGIEQPFCLWVRGPLVLGDLGGRAVAIVGSRSSTGYGEYVATQLASGIADRGHPVVSGAAYGVDAAAHRGALAVSGRTIGVLACGVDRSYPRGNERLIERIAHEGALISEVPPGAAPTRGRFLQRNRLIAALSTGTVVVEAAWRSGALNTAMHAARLGRPVAAVPGPVTSPASAGCHALLRDGAVCVTDATEVVELVTPLGQYDPAGPYRVVPVADHDGLGPTDLRVFDALAPSHAASVLALTRLAGLEESELLAALGRLQLRGLAARQDQGWRRTRPPRT